MDVTLLSAETDAFVHGLPGDCALALGLTWLPLTAGVSTASAVSAAVSNKATHVVHGSGNSAVGLARLKRPDLKYLRNHKVVRVLSAAALLARLKPIGTAMVVLPLHGDPPAEDLGAESGQSADTELFWVAAVSNGAVLRGHDLVCDSTRVDQVWSQLQARYQDKAARFDEGAEFGWADLVEAAAQTDASETDAEAELRPVKVSTGTALKSLPKSVRVGAALIVVAALAQYVAIPLITVQLAKYRKSREPKVDPVAFWQGAFADWASGKRLAGEPAIRAALDGIGALPGTIARWQLASAGCEAEPLRSAWKCTAQYVWPADAVGENASTSAAFKAAAPADWSLDWKPLGTVTVRFAVKAEMAKFDAKALQTRDWHLVETPTFLQGLDRVTELGGKPLGEFARVAVPAPKLPNGAVVAMPASIQLPLVAPLQVDGPLRSISEKVARMPHVSWKKVTVTVARTVKEPDRLKSGLKAQLQGEIYAKP
jgi:hypothetical protein